MEIVQEQKLIEAQIRARQERFASNTTKYAGGVVGAFIVPSFIAWLFFQQYVQLLLFAIVLLIASLGAGLYHILQRRGQTRAGMYIVLSSFLIVIVVEPILLPQLMPSVVMSFVLLAMMENLFLGNLSKHLFALFSILAFVGDLVLINVWTPAWSELLSEQVEFFINVLANALALIGTVIIIRMIMTEQESIFRQFQRANLNEQRQRQHLESTVQTYAGYMAEVGQGNLAARLALDDVRQETDDPLIMLGKQLNETAASLQRMILQIREAAGDLSSASTEILAATTQQVAGANEQSASISQMSAMADEVRAIAEQTVSRSQKVADVAQHTVKVSNAGQQVVQQTIASMQQIKERVEGIAENILVLAEQTQQIDEIITTVNDIAAQSNILALNAAVEAARAGEHGRGFAVVASEVRNLAKQSRQATAQVQTILSDIQKGTNATVMATEEGSKAVDSGAALVTQAQQVIEQLVGVINEAAQTATQMVVSGHQQASGVEQIAIAIQNINQATTQNLASTHQAETAAQNLNELALNMADIVEQYHL